MTKHPAEDWNIPPQNPDVKDYLSDIAHITESIERILQDMRNTLMNIDDRLGEERKIWATCPHCLNTIHGTPADMGTKLETHIMSCDQIPSSGG